MEDVKEVLPNLKKGSEAANYPNFSKKAKHCISSLSRAVSTAGFY